MRRALAVLLAVAALAGCTPGPAAAPRATPSTVDPMRIATNAGPFDAGPVPVPGTGAYVGAWVRPARLTQAGRIASVRSYEAALGRPLGIVNTYRRFDESFLTESDVAFQRGGGLLMLSWASGDTRSITLGYHDELIRSRARELKASKQPVLLRFRWEMDRPNLSATMWSAPDYVAAWRHVRKLFAAEGATNASWVWCPTAEGFALDRAAAYYPGDDTVDWVCADVYAGSTFRPLTDLLTPFLRWAAGRPKPIIIGEYGVARAWGSARRADWLRGADRLFRANPQIKAVSYFESDPDGEPNQFRLVDDPTAFAVLAETLDDPYYQPAP